MKNSNSTETTRPFTASDGRRFAFPVGAAFLTLSAVLLWRGRPSPMWVTASLGAFLLVAGLVLPSRLGPLYRAWMRLAHAISKVTTPIFMGIVYLLVFTPSGWIMKLVGRRPIEHRIENGTLWQPADHTHRDLRRQF